MYRQEEPQKKLSVTELEKAAKKHVLAYQVHVTDRLTSGQDHWYWNARGDRLAFIAKQTRSLDSDIRGKLLGTKAKGTRVEAFILDGRWVARCSCGGQEVVDPDDPLFVCLNPSCLNVANGHEPRPVKFPTKAKMRKLYGILLARQNPINRNWDPHGFYGAPEAIEDLETENVEHGLPKRVKVKVA